MSFSALFRKQRSFCLLINALPLMIPSIGLGCAVAGGPRSGGVESSRQGGDYAKYPSAQLDQPVDLRFDSEGRKLFPPVGAQFDNDCSAWACARYALTYTRALHDPESVGDPFDASWVWSHTQFSKAGADTSEVLEFLRTSGALRDSDTLFPLDVATEMRLATNNRIASFSRLERWESAVSALQLGHPVVALIRPDCHFKDASVQFYDPSEARMRTHVSSSKKPSCESGHERHVIAVVGFLPPGHVTECSTAKSKTKARFLLQNSWGNLYHCRGYIEVEATAIQPSEKGFGADLYAIDGAFYPSNSPSIQVETMRRDGVWNWSANIIGNRDGDKIEWHPAAEKFEVSADGASIYGKVRSPGKFLLRATVVRDRRPLRLTADVWTETALTSFGQAKPVRIADDHTDWEISFVVNLSPLSFPISGRLFDAKTGAFVIPIVEGSCTTDVVGARTISVRCRQRVVEEFPGNIQKFDARLRDKTGIDHSVSIEYDGLPHLKTRWDIDRPFVDAGRCGGRRRGTRCYTDWYVHIAATDDDRRMISKVTYELDPTYPERRVDAPAGSDSRFSLSGSGWGAFVLYANVELVDGSAFRLCKYLDISKRSKRDAALNASLCSGVAEHEEIRWLSPMVSLDGAEFVSSSGARSTDRVRDIVAVPPAETSRLPSGLENAANDEEVPHTRRSRRQRQQRQTRQDRG